jgi:hypothetical protein
MVQSISLSKVLKKFLELPDSFDSISFNYENLCSTSNNDVIENFVQSPYWQMKRSVHPEEAIVWPLFVYCDGVQCNNPLGSHSKVLDAVYVSLPHLPSECQASVSNIFLALLYDSSLRNDFADSMIFAPLITQLTSLEKKGILVQTKNGEKRVYFVTPLLLGDNKGLNSLLGFVEGFTANYFCRLCKCHKLEMYTQCCEDRSKLRDEINYNEDVEINDAENTGVKYDSAFNALPSFHATSNYVVDRFHDCEEGTCHYVIMHLLRHCIPRYFTVDCLNNRIAMFDFGLCESNTVPFISGSFASKSKLSMSGSEMNLFVRLLGLLIGDMVPEADPYWQLYLKMRSILDICQAKHLPKTTGTVLKVLVEEFNSMYVSVTKDTLKPKMHNWVHYPLVFSMSGLIDLLSTNRYESKHRELTVPAHATSSRTQISYTVALRHQLTQSYRFLSKESILPRLQVGSGEFVTLQDLDDYHKFSKSLSSSMVPSSLVFRANFVEIKGTVYKPSMCLLVNVNEHGPVFAEISHIFVLDGNDVLFIFTYFLNGGYNEHLQAYYVLDSERMGSVKPHNLYDYHPLYAHRIISGDKYVVLRHSL